MEVFFEYVAGIAAVIIASEMLLSLLPEGSMQGYVKLAAGVLILLLLLMPLGDLLGQDVRLPKLQESRQETTTEQKSYGDIILDVYNRNWDNMNNHNP